MKYARLLLRRDESWKTEPLSQVFCQGRIWKAARTAAALSKAGTRYSEGKCGTWKALLKMDTGTRPMNSASLTL